MDIQRRVDFLINYIRGSRKKFILSVFLVFLFTLIIFTLGAYYFLFNYYEGIIKEYYNSLMRNVSSFQEFLVNKGTYREDLKNIAESVKGNRGVLEVWCTDRFGKLIYHTDAVINEEFKSTRLYKEYHESINHVWNFNNGYPKPNIVGTEKWFIKRYSIPLYVSGMGDYDFVLGMDVKRFIFLPENIRHIILMSVGIFIFSLLVLFLPAFLWIRSRYNNIISRARVVMGSIELDLEEEKPPVPGEAEAPVQKLQEDEPEELEKIMTAVKTVEEKYTDEGREKISAVEEVDETDEEVPSVEEIVKAKEPSEEKPFWVKEAGNLNPLLLLMEKKQSIFNTEYVDLSFIEAGSFVYHSPGSQGSYFYYNRGSNCHFYTVFDYPEVEPERAVKQLSELTECLSREALDADETRGLFKGLNNYCLVNKLEINVSILMISDFEKKVEYASSGEMRSIYLKNNEEEIKDLTMDMPCIGKLSEKDFDDAFSYAEIGFVAGDIFALLPRNPDDILVDKETLFDLIKSVVFRRRELSVKKIGLEIHNTFEPVRRKKRSLPETGFAIFKFI
ncbi:MAG TPA: hypothetical protein ENI15_11705 [Spirochaetes bacterium]|nr:hypothetical protein [Spirochaetota bacterium]